MIAMKLLGLVFSRRLLLLHSHTHISDNLLQAPLETRFVYKSALNAIINKLH